MGPDIICISNKSSVMPRLLVQGPYYGMEMEKGFSISGCEHCMCLEDFFKIHVLGIT